MPERPFFVADGLSKSFGGLRAVDSISFAVEAGEILGIAGPNGSGKSTLFNIITNVPIRADSGRVIFDGRQLHHLRGHQICRRGLARTFQRESVFPNLSAIDNVLTAVEYSGMAGRFQDNLKQSEAALDAVEFPATMHNHFAGNLPVFHRKLVMIASALALQPRLLLLDEPASSLTRPEIQRMQAVIENLRARGMTIILIEHVLSLLTALSDRLIVLDQGKLLAEGKPDAVIADPKVVEAYLGGAA